MRSSPFYLAFFYIRGGSRRRNRSFLCARIRRSVALIPKATRTCKLEARSNRLAYPGPRGVNGLWCVFFMKSASVSGHPKQRVSLSTYSAATPKLCVVTRFIFGQSVDFTNVL